MSDIQVGVAIVGLYIVLLVWIVWRVETMLKGKLGDATAAHARATDALQAKTDRIERALAQVTDGANATVKRMARILRGDA